MTDVSRADPRRLPYLAFALVVACSLVSIEAVAQGDGSTAAGPIRLMPQAEAPEPEPRPLETGPIAEKARAPESIQVEGLNAVDPDSVGTIGPADGGLGVDMWSGTRRQFIELLLSRLPDRIESPTLRDLARRLLLTVARVPLAEKSRRAQANLLALRVKRLRSLGLVEEAGALLAAAPSRVRDSGSHRLDIEQMVIENNFDGACAELLRDGRRRTDKDWQRLSIYCQLRAGKTESAAFAANVLSETPGFDDRAFLALADRLGGAEDVKVASLPSPTPVHLAMLHDTKLPVPGDVANSNSPIVLRLVAMNDKVDVDIRLRAAERAALLGSLTPEKLRALYDGIGLPASDIERAMSIAEKDGSARARALLYRAARAQKVATAKAGVLRRAFESARAAGLTALTVRLYRPMLQELPASATLAWFAGDAARALLASGAIEAARPWLFMIRQRALRDDSARERRDGLWADVVLAGEAGSDADEPVAMNAWFATLKRQDGETAAAKAELVYALMQGIGIYPPDGFQEHVLALPPGKPRPSVAPPGVLQALAEAAAGRRRGEAVALTLIAFGRIAPGEAGAQVLSSALKGLVAVGLAGDAQALALETAAAAGL